MQILEAGPSSASDQQLIVRAEQLPLHCLPDKILLHSLAELGNELASEVIPQALETKDLHGRTALMLAVFLGRVEAVRLLVKAGANVNTECDGWTVVQEATSTGDMDLVQLVLNTRDRQRYSGGLLCGDDLGVHQLGAPGVPHVSQ